MGAAINVRLRRPIYWERMNTPQVKAIHRQLLAYAAAPVLIAVGMVVRDALLGPVAEPAHRTRASS